MKKKDDFLSLLGGNDTTTQNKGNGIGEWCKEHWFLTFLIVSSAIALPASIIKSVKGS